MPTKTAFILMEDNETEDHLFFNLSAHDLHTCDRNSVECKTATIRSGTAGASIATQFDQYPTFRSLSDTLHSRSSDISMLSTKSSKPFPCFLAFASSGDINRATTQSQALSDSKVIFVQTNLYRTQKLPKTIPSPDEYEHHHLHRRTDYDMFDTAQNDKKEHMKYWTVSIASKHNNVYRGHKLSLGTSSSHSCSEQHPQSSHSHSQSRASSSLQRRVCMSFGICDMIQCDDDGAPVPLDTSQLLHAHSLDNAYNLAPQQGQGQQQGGYKSYHTKLKSLDDILLSFNMKNNKLSLWQNGKRFNRTFQLESDKIYAFGIKLNSEDYGIKVLPNTGS
eukprot:CAMPEP_0202695514 /NCGR_PEP_ID=MMETSP1385-20130828/9095_1 /ASSEMBLY_ACC=CAM_ASM_000861 /TAXON_ID=933848 /ORGANISM="Elphidium margaritaceum" /LENGTH=333 /DNA_ID=CAMNT_0049351555 /DNA_START=224 /DNA_END=1225 /DNA_ORIENTATION=-